MSGNKELLEELNDRIKKLEQTLEVKPTTKDCSPGHVYWRSRAHLAEERLEKAERHITARNEELRTKAETETAHNAKRDELYESLRVMNLDRDSTRSTLRSLQSSYDCLQSNHAKTEQARTNACNHNEVLEATLEKWKRGDFIVPANGHNQFDLDKIRVDGQLIADQHRKIEVLKTKCRQWEKWTVEKQEKIHELRKEYKALEMSIRDSEPFRDYVILQERFGREKRRANTWRDRAIEKRREVTELNKELDGIQRRPSSGTEVHILVYGYKTQFQFQIAGVFSSRDLMYDWIRENPAASGEETETFTYTINKGEL